MHTYTHILSLNFFLLIMLLIHQRICRISCIHWIGLGFSTPHEVKGNTYSSNRPRNTWYLHPIRWGWHIGVPSVVAPIWQPMDYNRDSSAIKYFLYLACWIPSKSIFPSKVESLGEASSIHLHSQRFCNNLFTSLSSQVLYYFYQVDIALIWFSSQHSLSFRYVLVTRMFPSLKFYMRSTFIKFSWKKKFWMKPTFKVNL
jgi:hypothetical protein